MPDDEEVVATLKGFARAQVDNFNQNSVERRQAKGSLAEGGYCHGVCVDWARRVLQGGRPSFGPNPKRSTEEGYDFNARRQEQAKRQAYAWSSFVTIKDRIRLAANAQMAKNKSDYDSAYDGYVAEKAELLRVRTKLLNDYNANSHLGEAHVVKIDYGQDLLKMFPKLRNGAPSELPVIALRVMFETLQERSNNLASPVRAAPVSKEVKDQRTWAAFSHLMDTNLPKGRSFAGVSLIQLHPVKTFSTMRTAIAACLNPEPADFCAGRVMILSINLRTRKGDSGHAVATYWHPSNNHIFLDPNYGMFLYENLSGANSVELAMNYLFSKVYPTYPGVTVLNEIDYEIYAKKED